MQNTLTGIASELCPELGSCGRDLEDGGDFWGSSLRFVKSNVGFVSSEPVAWDSDHSSLGLEELGRTLYMQQPLNVYERKLCLPWIETVL